MQWDQYNDRKFPHNHLLSLQNYACDDIMQIFAMALELKEKQRARISHPICHDKSIAMIFTKPSARTRVSFDVGFAQLGGHTLYLTDAEIGLGTRESVPDVARVLSRMVDGIMIRTFAHSDVAGLAKHGSVPVINGLSDDFHPCQALADFLTFYEHKGSFTGKKVAYLGDGNNVANSLLLCGPKLGVSLAIACPAGYEPRADIVQAAKASAKDNATIEIVHDPKDALRGADAVYTDVWTSMGQEAEKQARLQAFAGYTVTSELMKHAKDDAIFMHCLPAHRGEEVVDDVIDGPNSVVFDEAENRLHAQKGVMALLI